MKKVLITGAGFVGSNLAERLLHAGTPVIMLDHLAREGVARSLRRLCGTYGNLVETHVKDVRDNRVVEELAARCRRVFHFAGQAFNIGGGPDNTVGLLEVIRHLSELSQTEPQIHYEAWRRGDQPYGVSHTRRFSRSTGRTPQVPVERGIAQLHQWLLDRVQSGMSQVRE